MAIVRKIFSQAPDYLSDDGALIVEVGYSQTALEAAFPNVAFTWIDLENGGEGIFILTKQQLLNINGN